MGCVEGRPRRPAGRCEVNDEMILVPRAELVAWAKAWLHDHGPNDGTDCVTPFDTYLLKAPVETQSGGEVVYIGAWAFDQLMSNKYVSCLLDTHGRATYSDGRPPVRLYTTPPSAPEAVERLRLALKMHDEHRTTLQSLASSVSDFLRDYTVAQQQQGQAAPPSASMGVEGLVERMRQAPDRLWMADLVGQKISVERMRDILTFALAQQPAALCSAATEDAAFNAGYRSGMQEAAWGVRELYVNHVHHTGAGGLLERCQELEQSLLCSADQQPTAAGEMAELVGLLDEVRSHFTRDDDLPDDLMPRIDAALRWIAGGES